MKQYWVSAIINGSDGPWHCALADSALSLEQAMKNINFLRENHEVLSAWIDTFDEDANGKQIKTTVFHECYVNALGNIEKHANK